MHVEQQALLESWREELRLLMQSHYAKSIAARRLNFLLGIPVMLIAVVVAGYVFFSINHNLSFWIKMLVGMLLVLGAILAALQTFLQYTEKSEHYRAASARYQSLYYAVEQLLVFPPQEDDALMAECERLRNRWDELNLASPYIGKVRQQYTRKAQKNDSVSVKASAEPASKAQKNLADASNTDVLDNFDIDILGSYDLNSRDR